MPGPGGGGSQTTGDFGGAVSNPAIVSPPAPIYPHYFQKWFQRDKFIAGELAPPPITVSFTTTVQVTINGPAFQSGVFQTDLGVTVSFSSPEHYVAQTTNVVVLTSFTVSMGGEMASGRYRR